MKNKTLFLILLASFVVYGQEVVKTDLPGGIFASDSLYSTYIDTSATPDDTLAAAQSYATVLLNFNYEWLTITVQDTGATYTDSLIVEFGTPAYTRNSERNMTVNSVEWDPVQFIKDSSWTQLVMPFASANSYKSYNVFVGGYWQVRIRRTNVQAVLNRVTYFTIQAAKKK